MLKRLLLIVSLLLFNFNLNADTQVTEKDVILAIKGGVESTKKFLEKVPTYQLYEYDKTIMHYAVELENYDVVEFLLSNDIELSRKGGIYYQTALQDAIFYQYFRIARILINNNADLDIKNIDGDTALHIAARNGYLDIANLLISNGASKNIYNANGETPYDLVPKLMMDSSKQLKAILKIDKRDRVHVHKAEETNGATFTLDSMKFNQATFILDKVNFDNQYVQSKNDNEEDNDLSLSSSKSIGINDDTTTLQDSSVGSLIKSH